MQNELSDEREGLPSASSMFRTHECPGWLKLCRDLPRKDTPDSLAGTAGHAALAGEDVELDSRQEVTVEECRRIADRIVKEFGFEGIQPIKEKRFWWYFFGRHMFSGQVDELYVRDKSFLVIDYKLLFGEHQEASANWQLRTLDLVVADSLGLEDSTCAIVQPWKKGQFSTTAYTPELRFESRIEIVAACEAALALNPPRTPGQHCRFCPGRSRCPEANNLLKFTLKAKHRSLETMTPMERGELLTWLKWGEDQISAKRAEIRAMIEVDPLAVTGWGLKPGKKRRSISNVSAAKLALSKYLTTWEVEGLCTLTPAALEVYLYDQLHNSEKLTRKEVKELVAAALGELVEETQDRESLVRVESPSLIPNLEPETLL